MWPIPPTSSAAGTLDGPHIPLERGGTWWLAVVEPALAARLQDPAVDTGCALMGPLAILLQSGLAALALATMRGKEEELGGRARGRMLTGKRKGE